MMVTEPQRDKRCDLCGEGEFQRICDRDRCGAPLGTDICRNCGLICHAVRPTDEELAEFYGTSYREQYHGESAPSARRVMRAWLNGQRIFRQLRPYLDREDRVIEIGAGIGCTVKSFRTNGYDACGVEPHAGFCDYGREQLKAPLQCASLEDLEGSGPYDAVLLIHVIEHFNSPRKALDRIRRLLTPSGRLYVECPNLATPFAPPGKMFHYAHVHNFTPETLSMLAARCGYEVEALFSSRDDSNLQMLLRNGAQSGLEIAPDAFESTRAALARYNWLTYHLRPGYMIRRARKLCNYAHERFAARGFVRDLIARCQASADNEVETHPAVNRAA